MSIYVRDRSPYYWVYLEHAPNGHQRQSTKVRIGKTPAERKDSKRVAEQLYAKLCLEYVSAANDLPQARTRLLFTDYADTYELDVLQHHKGYVREKEILKRWRVDLADMALDEIDQAWVRAWTGRRRTKVAARTVNREVDLLKSMLRDAVPKYLKANPLVRMRKLRADPPRRTIMTREDEAKLLTVCDPQDRALIIVGVDTMQRLSTLLNLKHSDRSPCRQYIYIPDSKNGQSATIPLSPDAAAALDWLDDDKGTSAYYFSSFRRAKNPAHWRSSVRQRLELLCERAGLSFGKKDHGLTWHWMTRRTGATRYVVDQGVPIPIVQSIGIWKSPKVMLEVYAEARLSEMTAAVRGFSHRVHTAGKSGT